MRQLLSLASGLYTDVAQLQAEFLRWHNTYLQAGTLEPCDSQMADYAVGSNGKRFVVSLLVCKNDVDAGEPLVQAWRWGLCCRGARILQGCIIRVTHY